MILINVFNYHLFYKFSFNFKLLIFIKIKLIMKSAKSAYSLSTNLASQYTERIHRVKKQDLRINTEVSHRIKSA